MLRWRILWVFVAVFSIILSVRHDAVAAPAAHLVIAEVQLTGGTGATTDEFVELYNPTDAAVPLAGWTLVKKTAAGSVYPLVGSFGEKTVPSHGFFLIGHPTGYAGQTLPDARYTTENSLASDNTVLLLDSAGATVDRVGFGSAGDREGTALSNPGGKKSVERKAQTASTSETMAEGGADTFRGNSEDVDDNSQDFVSRSAPEPQNSQSELESLAMGAPQPVVVPTPVTTPSAPTATTPTSQPTSTSTTNSSVTAAPLSVNRPPKAVIEAFEPDRKVRDVVHFSAKGSTDPDRDTLQYAWAFGDGGKATGRDADHAYKKAGRFTVILTVDDGKGGRATVEATVRITDYDRRPGLVLNELFPNPDADESEEWLEVKNEAGFGVNLDGWAIVVGKKRYRFPETILASGGYLLLSREQSGIALPNNGSLVYLQNPDAKVVQGVEYPKAAAGSSFSRKAGKTWQWTDIPTPGQENVFADPLVLGASVEAAALERQGEPLGALTGESSMTPSPKSEKLPEAGAVSAAPPSADPPTISIAPDKTTNRVLFLFAVVAGGCVIGLIGFIIRKRLDARRLRREGILEEPPEESK